MHVDYARLLISKPDLRLFKKRNGTLKSAIDYAIYDKDHCLRLIYTKKMEDKNNEPDRIFRLWDPKNNCIINKFDRQTFLDSICHNVSGLSVLPEGLISNTNINKNIETILERIYSTENPNEIVNDNTSNKSGKKRTKRTYDKDLDTITDDDTLSTIDNIFSCILRMNSSLKNFDQNIEIRQVKFGYPSFTVSVIQKYCFIKANVHTKGVSSVYYVINIRSQIIEQRCFKENCVEDSVEIFNKAWSPSDPFLLKMNENILKNIEKLGKSYPEPKDYLCDYKDKKKKKKTKKKSINEDPDYEY